MRPEEMTTYDNQVVEIIKQHQQEHNGQAMPHRLLLEAFEQTLPEDQKFKSAEYLTTVLADAKVFNSIKGQDTADRSLEYTVAE